MSGRSSLGSGPQPRPPATASSSPSSASRSNASTSVSRFFRGSSVATVSTYGFPRSAFGPSARKCSPMPGCATITRSRGKESVAATSSAVNDELAKITSQVRAALTYFRRCIDCVLPVVHSGWWSGTRSCTVVARTPLRCGGYIQSLKWSTSTAPSQRSAGGLPSADHAVRQTWAPGSGISRSSTSTPATASAIARRPANEVGANAITSCPRSPATSPSPPSDPRM